MKDRIPATLVASLVTFVAVFVFVWPAPSVEPNAVVDSIGSSLGAWTIVIVAVLAFLETGAFVGLLVPGETAVIVGGAVAGRGLVGLAPMLVAVWLATAAGDSVSFLLGRRHGRGLLLRHGPRVRITAERVERVERHFANAGARTILVGRFLGVVRAVAPFVAGAAGMSYRRFVVVSLAGTAAWSAVFVLLGYGLSRSLDQAEDVGSWIGMTVGVLVIGWLLARMVRRRRAARDAPPMRPVPRAARAGISRAPRDGLRRRARRRRGP